MTVLYLLVSIYYRRTSVETKRLDSLMRSDLYGSYSGMESFFSYENRLLIHITRDLDWFINNPGVRGTGENE